MCVGGVIFALLEVLLEPWRSFEELWRRFEVLEAILSFEVQSAGLVLFGGISKHWMCMCPHSSIVSLDLSWLNAI